MARTARRVTLKPSRDDERPDPIPLRSPGFSADLGLVEATQLDHDSVILLPEEYIHDPDDSSDADWRDESNAGRCWKTALIYEQIGQNHPRLATYLRRDPWTACPVLEKPSGPPLTQFINQHRSTMYSAPTNNSETQTRILDAHKPLICQWALHLISGLSFVHGHDVIFGDLALAQCWLSSDSHMSLSLVGFVNAGFKAAALGGVMYPGSRTNAAWFHPLEHTPIPTTQTDLFLFGCVIYELMTGAWPGDRVSDRSGPEVAMMISRGEWPSLEPEYMGDIVHRCWSGEITDALQLKAEIVEFLETQGFGIEGDDILQGFDVAGLFP